MPFVDLDNSKKDGKSESERPDVPAFDPNIPIVGKSIPGKVDSKEKTNDVTKIEDADFRPMPEMEAQKKSQSVANMAAPSIVTPSSENNASSEPEARDDGVVVTSKPFKDIEQPPSVEGMKKISSKDQNSEIDEAFEKIKNVKPIEKKVQEATKTSFTDAIPKPVVEPPKRHTIQPEQPLSVDPVEKVASAPIKKMKSFEKKPELSTKLTTRIEDYAKICLEKRSSDIHFTAEYPVYYRIDGRLEKHSAERLSADQTKTLLYSILSDEQKKQVEAGKEIDFMYVDPVKNRFRVNVYWEKGDLAGAFRSIPKRVRTVEELGLPPILKEFSKVPYGLVLVTGPTGSGKSTSIAAMIEEINATEPRHIITIEDPVEYVYEPKVALIAQRNMHEDTKSWNDALRAALRQDPDVVLVGEMRDYETVEAALTIAETGHLVFATLHTNSAAQTIDRIIDVFPGDQQNQVRTQLGNMLSGVISQRLVPLKNGGRKAAMEVLIASNAVKSAIREGKTHQIDNIIQTSSDIGMFTLEKSLVDLIRMNEIDIQTAKNFTIKPDQIDLLLK